MMTTNNAFNQIVTTLSGLISIIDRELGTMELLGNTDARDIFTNAIDLLQSSTGGSGFVGGVRMLNAINTCAKLFEEQSTAEPDVTAYWLEHAYEFRRSGEMCATDLLHSLGSAPQFERSLSHLRISCAHLAKQLGKREESMMYIQGALRLAAPESDIELAKKVMQAH